MNIEQNEQYLNFAIHNRDSDSFKGKREKMLWEAML